MHIIYAFLYIIYAYHFGTFLKDIFTTCFGKKWEKILFLDSVGKVLFLPLPPLKHHQNQSGKSRSEFFKSLEQWEQMAKVAKISLNIFPYPLIVTIN